MNRALLLPLLLLFGCPAEDEPTPRYSADQVAQVDFICPGDPSGVCDRSDDLQLHVGAAAVVTTPVAYESWIDEDDNGEFSTAIDTVLDCGLDRLCPGDPGYSAPDEGELDGQFQALWLAGFGNSRAMQDVADDTWARATVLIQGNTEIAVVSADLIGLFLNQVETIRERARSELGIDHVILSSTHVHEAPDTMGQWGRNIATSGVNPEHMARIHDATLDAIGQALDAAQPAEVRAGRYDIPPEAWNSSGVNNVNIDTRDPAITDETVSTTRFVASNGETIATWINFANHPEAAGSDNLSLTSDFAHTLRETVEQGAPEGPDGALAGVGGVAVYVQGAVGGMMTPLRCDTVDLDGTVESEDDVPKAYAVGRVLGYHALQALGEDVAVPDPTLRVRIKQFFLAVENTGFHVMLNAGVFERPGYHYDEDEIITQWNRPDLKTEVDLLEIGSVAALTIPGELLPELAIGGYDGSHTGPLQEIIETGNPLPPDLSAAPEGPYLKDLMPGEHRMIVGLGNDEIGYFVPDYNFVLAPSGPYLNEADGDHYEETNSVGESAVSRMLEVIGNLLAWQPPPLE